MADTIQIPKKKQQLRQSNRFRLLRAEFMRHVTKKALSPEAKSCYSFWFR